MHITSGVKTYYTCTYKFCMTCCLYFNKYIHGENATFFRLYLTNITKSDFVLANSYVSSLLSLFYMEREAYSYIFMKLYMKMYN